MISLRLPSSVVESAITPSSATIQWTLTDPYNPARPETFTVVYGRNPDNLDLSSPGVTASASSQTYSIQLHSLEPGTEYFYKIEARNRFDIIFTDDKYSFMTDDISKL